MSSENTRDYGLLVMRVGLGAMFMAHGWPKLAGGADKWAKLGGAMSHLGIDFAPVMWGFMGASAEFFGGMLVALGLAFRPACAALVGTMVVAANLHIAKGDGIMGASHAIEAGIAFLGLLLIGAGRFSLDRKFFNRG